MHTRLLLTLLSRFRGKTYLSDFARTEHQLEGKLSRTADKDILCKMIFRIEEEQSPSVPGMSGGETHPVGTFHFPAVVMGLDAGIEQHRIQFPDPGDTRIFQ